MSTKNMKRVTTASGDPIKIIACPRQAMLVGGELIAPGELVEIFGYREISQIGTEPDPIRYCWMELYKNAQSEPMVIASMDGDWWEAKNRAQAEEASGAEDVRQQYAREQEELAAHEKRMAVAKGEMPTTLDEANAKIRELQAKVDAKGGSSSDTGDGDMSDEMRARLIRLSIPNVADEDYTQSGVPSTDAIEDLTGLEGVSAAERDAAWADFQGE